MYGIAASAMLRSTMHRHCEACQVKLPGNNTLSRAPMQERVDRRSITAKMASLGSVTPMLAIVFSSVRYAPPCDQRRVRSAVSRVEPCTAVQPFLQGSGTATGSRCLEMRALKGRQPAWLQGLPVRRGRRGGGQSCAVQPPLMQPATTRERSAGRTPKPCKLAPCRGRRCG